MISLKLKILIVILIDCHTFLLFLVYEFGNIAFVTYLTTQRGTVRLYFDHSWTETVNGKRLEKQENDLSEVRYFQARVQEPVHRNPK